MKYNDNLKCKLLHLSINSSSYIALLSVKNICVLVNVCLKVSVDKFIMRCYNADIIKNTDKGFDGEEYASILRFREGTVGESPCNGYAEVAPELWTQRSSGFE